ncbi:MAG TPA: hypothetical protein O0X23_01350, partial [Methanocorpusculum sp.]|nr:hypothetical protein [Methanocorpusculum sp.]
MDEDLITSCKGYWYQDGSVLEIDDVVVREDTVTLFLNGKSSLRMVASCDMLPELGAGFFTAAGIAKRVVSVRAEGTEVFVEAELRCDMPLEPLDGFSPATQSRCIATDGMRV